MEADRKGGLRVVGEARRIEGKQGVVYEQGVSAELVGSRAIHLQVLAIPPGARERAHKHADHETAIYVVAGRSGVWWGEDLENDDEPGAGSFVYVPANLPHMPFNFGATEV